MKTATATTVKECRHFHCNNATPTGCNFCAGCSDYPWEHDAIKCPGCAMTLGPKKPRRYARRPAEFSNLGEWSHGTLLMSDLLPVNVDALKHVVKWSGDNHGALKLVRGAQAFIDRTDDDEMNHGDAAETATELLNDLENAINERCPSMVQWGPNEGDGASIGFWVDFQSIDNAAADGELLKLASGDPIPPETPYGSAVAFVNDHGNVTFGVVQRGYPDRFRPLWSVV